MKKIVFLFSIAAAMLAASCSQVEEDFSVVKDGEAVAVSFTAEVCDQVMTRAYSDGSYANMLEYAVFQNGTMVLSSNGEKKQADATGQWKFSVDLVKGLSYDIVFWAAEYNAPYTFDEETGTVTLTTTTLDANNDKLDAFYGKESFTVDGPMNRTIMLRRPFAQVNVATSEADYNAANSQAGISINTSEMIIEGAKNKFNLLDKAAEGDDVNITFTANAANNLETVEINGAAYMYLTRNYIFTDNANVSVSFKVTYNTDKILEYNDIHNVPVAENYRTNIYGDLFMNPVSLTVVKVPAFNPEDNNFNIHTASSNESLSNIFTTAAGKGEKNVSSSLTKAVDEIEAPAEFLALGSSNEPAVINASYDNETPETVTVKEENADETSESAEESKAVFTTTGNGETADYNHWTPNSTGKVETSSTWNIENSDILTAGQTFYVGQGVNITTLNLYGGNLVISGSVTEIEDMRSDKSSTIYYVLDGGSVTTIPDGFKQISSLEELALIKALENSGSYALNADLNITSPIFVDKAFTLDLNGHNITGDVEYIKDKQMALIEVLGNGNLTIKGKGSVKSDHIADDYAVNVRGGGNLTIEDGEYNGGCTAVNVVEGAASIKGGKFSQDNTAEGQQKYGDRYVINCLDANHTAGTARINITGGKFKGFNPSAAAEVADPKNYLGENCISSELGDGWYEVFEVKAGVVPTVTDYAAFKTVMDVFCKIQGKHIINIGTDITLTDAEADARPYYQTQSGHTNGITINGNGHYIENLHNALINTTGSGNVYINDLTIQNSKIKEYYNDASGVGNGAFVSNMDTASEVILTNCHLKESTIGDTTSGGRNGGLVGYSAGYGNQNDGAVYSIITITGCSVEESTIYGSSVGGINGHAGGGAWTKTTIENCSVKKCTLTSNDSGGWRVGQAIGTAGVGISYINNLTVDNNILSQGNVTETEAAKKWNNVFGRFVPNTTGQLFIDDTEVK